MLQKFTIRWRNVQTNSLPLANKNFPKPTNHIPRLFKDFQGLELATFEFKYFQALSGTHG